MSEDQKPRPVIPNQIDEELKKKLSDEEEKNAVFSALDELDNSKWLDENLDIENAKQAVLNSPSQIEILGALRIYGPIFLMTFYRAIYRLRGWPITDESLRRRPGIVAYFTNYLIYLRYPLGTLRKIQKMMLRNADGKPLFKQYHYLTLIGEIQLVEFMKEATDLMNECACWSQFVRRFAKRYGKLYQGDLFDNED